jgi:hypothetical protein
MFYIASKSGDVEEQGYSTDCFVPHNNLNESKPKNKNPHIAARVKISPIVEMTNRINTCNTLV